MYSGIGIQNIETSSVSIQMTLRDRSGTAVPNGTATIPNLPGRGHLAMFIHQLFPNAALDDFSGSLIAQVSGGRVAATAPELGSTAGQFTTLPVAPAVEVGVRGNHSSASTLVRKKPMLRTHSAYKHLVCCNKLQQRSCSLLQKEQDSHFAAASQARDATPVQQQKQASIDARRPRTIAWEPQPQGSRRLARRIPLFRRLRTRTFD